MARLLNVLDHTVVIAYHYDLYLKDFEALTPNLLARTIETIEGGGIVCVLLQNMTSLKKLYTMTMVFMFKFYHNKIAIIK